MSAVVNNVSQLFFFGGVDSRIFLLFMLREKFHHLLHSWHAAWEVLEAAVAEDIQGFRKVAPRLSATNSGRWEKTPVGWKSSGG